MNLTPEECMALHIADQLGVPTHDVRITVDDNGYLVAKIRGYRGRPHRGARVPCYLEIEDDPAAPYDESAPDR